MHNDKNKIIFNNTKANNCAGEDEKPKGLIENPPPQYKITKTDQLIEKKGEKKQKKGKETKYKIQQTNKKRRKNP